MRATGNSAFRYSHIPSFVGSKPCNQLTATCHLSPGYWQTQSPTSDEEKAARRKKEEEAKAGVAAPEEATSSPTTPETSDAPPAEKTVEESPAVAKEAELNTEALPASLAVVRRRQLDPKQPSHKFDYVGRTWHNRTRDDPRLQRGSK